MSQNLETLGAVDHVVVRNNASRNIPNATETGTALTWLGNEGIDRSCGRED